MFTALLSLIPNLIGIGADWLKGKRELKAAKVEGQLAVTNAITMSNIKLAETGQLAEIDWSLSMERRMVHHCTVHSGHHGLRSRFVFLCRTWVLRPIHYT